MKGRLFYLLPWLFFVIIIGLAAVQMYNGRGNELPSTLVGLQAPGVPETGLPPNTVLTDADLRAGDVTVVNFWASWCPPCRAEHPTLTALAEQGYRVAGINFRDHYDTAQRYLDNAGNPFFALGFDASGRNSIDWGVTAPPETFIVDGTGKVLFRFVGPLVGSDYEQRFLPALAAATQAGI